MDEYIENDDIVVKKDDEKSDKDFDYQPYVEMVLNADYDL